MAVNDFKTMTTEIEKLRADLALYRKDMADECRRRDEIIASYKQLFDDSRADLVSALEAIDFVLERSAELPRGYHSARKVQDWLHRMKEPFDRLKSVRAAAELAKHQKVK